MEKKIKNIFLDTDGIGFEKFKEDYLKYNELKSKTEFEREQELWDIYGFHTRLDISETKAWLHQKTDYPILGFADLGFWNGRTKGCAEYGDNLADIIDLRHCDRGIFYYDRYNVKADLIHHDGTHHLTFRMAKNDNVANKIMELAERGKLTYEYFMKNTISLFKIKDFKK